MSLDKAIEHKKEHRKQYRGAKLVAMERVRGAEKTELTRT